MRDYGGWLQMVLWGTMADFPRGRRVSARRHWLQLATRAARRGWLSRGYSHIGALGLEPTPELYVAHMVEVFREVRRVLRSDGTLWLNLGDSRRDKQWLGMPHLVRAALQADGWRWADEIVWSKPNPMPESVRDRTTRAHEFVFLMVKQQRYFYDADAIREPVKQSSIDRVSQNDGHPKFEAARERRESGHIEGRDTLRADQLVPEGGRNARSVWTIATQPYPGAHFATYPEKLVEPCILAGSSPKACGVCAAPWERVTELTPEYEAFKAAQGWQDGTDEPRLGPNVKRQAHNTHPAVLPPKNITTGWRPTCAHDDDSGSCLVLDPFNGSGTTGRVALRLGRRYVGVDISREYLIEQASHRLGITAIANIDIASHDEDAQLRML